MFSMLSILQDKNIFQLKVSCDICKLGTQGQPIKNGLCSPSWFSFSKCKHAHLLRKKKGTPLQVCQVILDEESFLKGHMGKKINVC